MTDTVNAPETSTTAAPPEGPRGVWDYPAHPPADRPVDPTPSTTHTGWYFVGFTTEFTDTITGLRLAGRELMVVADGSGFRLFDAVCPHRGANLAVGGVLRGDCVTCPFHGKSVLLGRTVAPPRLGVSRYPLLVIGELMFARLADDPDGDRGFSAVMTQYLATHRFHAGTREPVSIDPQFIVENAFDTSHFTAVHHVPRAELMPAPASAGELVIDGYMEYAAPGWTGAQRGVRIRNRFHASAFSPTVVVTEVGDRPHQQLVVTGGLPTENGCEVLIGYGLTPDPGADDVDERRVEAMVKSGEIALAQDIPIWSNIDESVVPLYDVRDEPVRAFRRWCADFPRRTR